MAIEINGVSLPDIPDGALDNHPYAVILKSEKNNMYSLVTTPSEIYFLSLFVSGYLYDSLECAESGSILYTYIIDASTEWAVESEDTTKRFSYYVGTANADTISLLWSNHDIKKAASVDDNGIPTSYDGLYFLNSTVTFEEEYSAPGTWFEGMATQARRFSGVTKRYTTDEMLSALKNTQKSIPLEMIFDGFQPIDEGISCLPLYNLGFGFKINHGVRYLVEWDGTTYECTATEEAGGFGNAYLNNINSPDTGEPFFITFDSVIIASDDKTYHYISISELT